MKYLFIGGFADGSRIDVPDGRDVWRLRETEEPSSALTAASDFVAGRVRFTDHLYKKESLHDGNDGAVTYVYIHNGGPVMKKLVAGYRKGSSTPPGTMELLDFIYARMNLLHHESKRVDYMVAFRKFIDSLVEK